MNPEDINKQIQNINQSVNSLNKEKSANLSGLSNIAISADTLKTPQQPMKLAQPRPETAYAGLQGVIESNAPVVDQFTQNLQADKQGTEKTKTQALSDLVKNMLGTKGQTSLTAESYAKTVDPVEKELNDINQKIREEQQSLRRITEAVQTESGLTKGQVNQRVSEIQRQSLRKQADLSVIQQGIQGRFDSAKAIADRAVQAQLEQQKIANEVYRLNYEENKEAFTTAEKRLFETQLSDRERKLNQEEKRLQEISDLSLQALQDGAPSAIVSAMRGAKTPEEAIKIGGSYVGALDRQLKQEQIATARASRARMAIEADTKAIKESKDATLIQEAKSEKALGMLESLKALKKSSGLDTAVGPNPLVRGFSPEGAFAAFITGSTSEFKSEVERIANSLTLENMELLKGPATDKDVELVAASMSRLKNFDVTQSSYKKEIERIEEAMERIVSNVGITDEQAQFYFDLSEDDIAEVNSIFGIDNSNSTAQFNPANYFSN